MKNTEQLIAFGPVPSRRLGQSLGINNIPPKNCTYSCIYCQVGVTGTLTTERKEFYGVDDIVRKTKKKISEAGKKGEIIDYLAFVPDGEPSLDINLGREIAELKMFGINIAVITNASLVWDKSVRDDLTGADWVSLKIDAVTEKLWRKINRPHRSLKLENILQGISEFSKVFKGTLATETMLVKGINDSEEEIEKISDFISGLRPGESYISIPTRPPAEKKAGVPDENVVNRAYQIFTGKGINAGYLIGYEGNAFAFTGDVKKDILSITSVHPMKEEAVIEFLNKAGEKMDVVEALISEGSLKKVSYRGQSFYMRKLQI